MRTGRAWPAWPLAVSAIPLALLAALSLLLIAARYYNVVPPSPWDAAALVEADRLAHGLPLYEPPQTGHSGWMYGPVVLLLGGLIFSVLSPSLYVFKLLSIAASAGLVWLGLAAVRDDLTPRWRCVVLLSFVAIESRIAYTGVVRPDAVALLFAMLALLAAYRGRIVAACGLMAAGVLTKQPVVAFALVPALAGLVEGRGRLDGRRLRALAIPVAGVAPLLVLPVLKPAVWTYMIDEARQYPVPAHELVKDGLAFLAGSPALAIAAAAALLVEAPRTPDHVRRLVWTIVAFAVGLGASIVSQAKTGGGANSLMPAFAIEVVLTWLLVGPVLAALSPRRRTAFGSLLCIAFFLAFSTTGQALVPLIVARSSENRDYREVVAKVRALPGGVLSPFDPSITLFARGQHDPSAILSLDTFGLSPRLPPAIVARAYTARYIVQRPEDRRADILSLPERGYRIVWRNRTYAIWQAPA